MVCAREGGMCSDRFCFHFHGTELFVSFVIWPLEIEMYKNRYAKLTKSLKLSLKQRAICVLN